MPKNRNAIDVTPSRVAQHSKARRMSLSIFIACALLQSCGGLDAEVAEGEDPHDTRWGLTNYHRRLIYAEYVQGLGAASGESLATQPELFLFPGDEFKLTQPLDIVSTLSVEDFSGPGVNSMTLPKRSNIKVRFIVRATTDMGVLEYPFAFVFAKVPKDSRRHQGWIDAESLALQSPRYRDDVQGAVLLQTTFANEFLRQHITDICTAHGTTPEVLGAIHDEGMTKSWWYP